MVCIIANGLVIRVQCMYDAGFEVGPGFVELFLALAGPVDVGVGAPSLSLSVTFELCHASSIGLAEAFQ